MSEGPEGAAPPATPRVGRSVLWMIVTRAALLPLGLLQGALLARRLQPAGLGRYSALLTDVNLLVTVLSIGLPGALSVLLSEERGRLRPLLRLALRHGALCLLLPGALCAALALGRPGAFAAIDRLPAEVVLIAALCAAQYLRDALNALLLGGQQFGAQNWQQLALSLFQLALLSALLLSGRLDPRSAVGLQIASNALLCVLAARTLGRLLRSQPPVAAAGAAAAGTAPADLGPRARRIGARNFLHILPDLLLMRIDVYLIQTLIVRAAAGTELGLYQAGVRIAELVLLLPSALNAVLFAKAAAREDLTAVTIAGAKLSLWLGLLCLAGMALVGQPLLGLFYGPRFSGSFLPCLLVLLGCCALCFSGPLAGTLAGAGAYPRSVIVAQVVALVCNVGANLYLIPRHGALGAAGASALSYATSAAVIAWAFCARFSVPASALLRIESPLRLLQAVRRS